MNAQARVDVIEEIFHCIERRDLRRLQELTHPDAEFHWPPSLPHGGVLRGLGASTPQQPTWEGSWIPLQPTDAERHLDPRVIAASDADGDEVVVLWWQRGRSPSGERHESPVLGLYQVRDGKLARAQMFYFDPAGAAAFLERA